MRPVRYLAWIGAFALLLMGAAWLVLSSALFRDFRVELVSDRLTKIIGQEVVIDGDVHLSFLPRPAIITTLLRLPVEGVADLDLARLEMARFAIFGTSRLRAGIFLPEIEARGLDVTLIRGESGATTWVGKPAGTGVDTTTSEEQDLIAFLGIRDIHFSDMRIHAENRATGFRFDLELEDFMIAQLGSGEEVTAEVSSKGVVNEQPFAFSGDFPQNAAFVAEGRLGALTFDLDGQAAPGLARGDFDGTLRLRTDSLQNLLDLLRLDGVIDGSAEAEVALVRRNTHLDMEDIDLRLQNGGGETARLTGRFSDARFGPDFDLVLEVDLVGSNAPPAPAIFFKDIRVLTAQTHVVADKGDIEIERFSLRTNAFDEEIRDVGPFRVAKVIRTPEGHLKLDGVTFLMGPPDAPFFTARESVDNLLAFRGYRLTGDLNLPAQRVLLTLLPEEATRFGRLTGTMKLYEAKGEPFLEEFKLQSQDTDLWSAALDLKSEDVDDFDNLDLKARISTDDGGAVLEALRLKRVDIGRMGIEANASRRGNTLLLQTLLSAGQSDIDTDLSMRVGGEGAVLRGAIRSDALRIEDLRNNLLALIEVGRMRSVYMESRQNTQEDEFQPLVLPDAETPEDDLSGFQPLVLPEAAAAPEPAQDLSGFQPLVISDDPTDLVIGEVLDPTQLPRLIDAEIDIDIARITGQAGVSALKSTFEMKSGKAVMGPVRLTYAKGFADVTGRVDLIEAPGLLRVSGQTGGWDFGNILDSLGSGIGAYGILNGRFDLTGRPTTARSFVESMRGTATIDMRDGRVETGLIELAGLGVLPWLFSKERRRGYTDLVCLKAPLRISNGRIETREVVLETPRVQLVGAGTIDVPGDRISFTAEPRPVGEPLSRSAWPIEISGRLSAPQVKVAERKIRRATVPLSMPGTRTPCVPDVKQLQPVTNRPR